MGGAKSKFEETDWVRADGNLTNRADTIDGSPPTSAYGVYYLTKTKLNQREFQVTDLESNLLYTTKCVPGTLCWFDVYGNGMDDCRLRVQVDLSRRYWLIYRMGIPTFAGQLADREATDKLASDRRAALEDLSATPFLFRKCCITVSWSRYMAVAMQYGPPDKYTDRMRKKASEESLEHHGSCRIQEFGDEKDNGQNNKDNNNNQHDSTTYYSYDATNVHDSSSLLRASNSSSSLQASNSSIHDSEKDDTTDTGPETTTQQTQQQEQNTEESPASASWWTMKKKAQEFQDMIKENTQAYQDNHKKKLKADPLEGIIHLDKKPILLCQEIYDKLIGNHQTSLLSKEKAIEYLRQDLEDHMNDGGFDGDDPFLADQEGIVAQLEALRRMEEEPAKDTKVEAEAGEQAATQEEKEKGGNKDDNHLSIDTNGQPTNGSNGDAPIEGEAPTQPVQSPSKKSLLGNANDNPKLDGPSKASEMEESIEGEELDLDSQSLIGYWKWENTWSVHQMKMHLGKGSDLALHVVMAIIVNQVRYERNAIAMTV